MKILSILLIALLPLMSFSQHNHSGPCATDEINRELEDQYPYLKDIRAEMDAYVQEYITNALAQQGPRRSQVYTIPLVIHILHNYGVENISDEQVYDAVRILNEDFRKRNADTTQIVPAFRDIAADCEIEFRLATIDPKGNCTNGIDRIQSTATYIGDNLAKLNPWPRDMYLNVWVVNAISRDGNVLGYAILPSSASGLVGLLDGIVLLHNSMGNIGSGNPSWSRTLSHEVGHSLSLIHTWGGSNEPGVACGDDGIFDTPVTRGTFGCNLNLAQCNPPIIENVQNIMDYSSCPRMFTEGQKLAMHATLNSATAKRNNLWQPETLAKTGADVSTNTNTCPPVADFNSVKKNVCLNDPVQFTDYSWRGPVTAWEWTFTNANPPVSNDKNPVVTFTQPGWQTVTLTVTSAFGQDTRTKESLILVNESTPLPLEERFEDEAAFNNNYYVQNFDNNESAFRINGNASYSGGQSLVLNTFDVGRYDIDEFITPLFTVAGRTTFNFKYSHATKATTIADMEDRLRVYYSINCGATWVQMLIRTGNQIVNAGFHNDYFIPSSDADWAEINIPLPPQVIGAGTAIFRFEFTSARGNSNNFYIDNINVDDNYTSTTELEKEALSFNIFPNPTAGVFSVQLNSAKPASGWLKVFDRTGKQILLERHDFHAGVNTRTITADLAEGIYYVVVMTEEKIASKSLMVVAGSR